MGAAAGSAEACAEDDGDSAAPLLSSAPAPPVVNAERVPALVPAPGPDPVAPAAAPIAGAAHWPAASRPARVPSPTFQIHKTQACATAVGAWCSVGASGVERTKGRGWRRAWFLHAVRASASLWRPVGFEGRPVRARPVMRLT
eukprot:CAMPEP_0119471492 /NCGR_PEP_ID=MMETSP1344-20130328/3932_1 /TAXON_ID=236787 /ORGANISM="Florenciella parvula, Strain CCMP2471" /LENGTH=142 /DNA_ID=CAMNT_0007504279 /DNA_START=716 /DNA_END=1145 /DNA_ORIENTATION=+